VRQGDVKDVDSKYLVKMLWSLCLVFGFGGFFNDYFSNYSSPYVAIGRLLEDNWDRFRDDIIRNVKVPPLSAPGQNNSISSREKQFSNELPVFRTSMLRPKCRDKESKTMIPKKFYRKS